MKLIFFFRFLQPSNIFLMKESMQIKIGDFGLACLQSVVNNCEASNESTTNTQYPQKMNKKHAELTQGIGTSMYASPEQLAQSYYDKNVI